VSIYSRYFHFVYLTKKKTNNKIKDPLHQQNIKTMSTTIAAYYIT